MMTVKNLKLILSVAAVAAVFMAALLGPMIAVSHGYSEWWLIISAIAFAVGMAG